MKDEAETEEIQIDESYLQILGGSSFIPLMSI